MNIGIDVGSTAIKIVFVEEDRIVWRQAVPTKPGQPDLVDELISEGRTTCSLSEEDIKKVSVTGYGRNLILSSNQVVDEITANTAGIYRLTSGKARTLINIGGQDVKIIKLSETGEVLDFRMNDKCAAGTGRFFELAAKILDTPLQDFHLSHAASDEAVHINSTCAVFAESEIVSLMATGVNKHSIIKGLNQAVAARIAKLAGGNALDEDVYMDGGPAGNRGLIESLEDALMCDIKVVDKPQFTVAFGSLFVD